MKMQLIMVTTIEVRDDLKTQRPVSFVLNNDNSPELDGTASQPVVGF